MSIKHNVPPARDFTRTPNGVIRHRKLAPQEKVVLLVIMSHRASHDLTMKQIEDEAGCDVRATRKAVKGLEDKGFLSRIARRDNRGRVAGYDWVEHDPDAITEFTSEQIRTVDVTRQNAEFSQVGTSEQISPVDVTWENTVFPQVSTSEQICTPKKTVLKKTEEGGAGAPALRFAQEEPMRKMTLAEMQTAAKQVHPAPNAPAEADAPGIDDQDSVIARRTELVRERMAIGEREQQATRRIAELACPAPLRGEFLRWAKHYESPTKNKVIEVFLVARDVAQYMATNPKAGSGTVGTAVKRLAARQLSMPSAREEPLVEAACAARDELNQRRRDLVQAVSELQWSESLKAA